MCNAIARTGKHKRVCGQVEQQYESAEHDLRSARQSAGIQQWLDVMLDKSSAVPQLAATHAQRILQRRQRANPSGELDEHSPHRRRDMERHYCRPAQREQAAQNNESDESEMD